MIIKQLYNRLMKSVTSLQHGCIRREGASPNFGKGAAHTNVFPIPHFGPKISHSGTAAPMMITFCSYKQRACQATGLQWRRNEIHIVGQDELETRSAEPERVLGERW